MCIRNKQIVTVDTPKKQENSTYTLLMLMIDWMKNYLKDKIISLKKYYVHCNLQKFWAQPTCDQFFEDEDDDD